MREGVVGWMKSCVILTNYKLSLTSASFPFVSSFAPSHSYILLSLPLEAYTHDPNYPTTPPCPLAHHNYHLPHSVPI